MKKIAVLLTMLLVLGTTIHTVVAETVDISDVRTLSENEVFLSWGGVAVRELVRFDRTFLENQEVVLKQKNVAQTGTVNYTIAGASVENGATLHWKGTGTRWYPLQNSDTQSAILVNTKFTGSGSEQASILVGMNSSYYASIYINRNGTLMTKSSAKWDYWHINEQTTRDGKPWAGEQWNVPRNIAGNPNIMMSYLFAPTETGYRLFARANTDEEGKWTYLGEAVNGEAQGTWSKISGVKICGPVLVESIEVLEAVGQSSSGSTIELTDADIKLFWWSSPKSKILNFDEESGNPEWLEQEGISQTDGETISYTTNGLKLKEGQWLWRNGLDTWYPMGKAKSAVCFKAKVDLGETLSIIATRNAGRRTYMDVTPTGVKIYEVGDAPIADISFVPDTGWNEYLMMTEDSNYSLYTRKEGEELWTKCFDGIGYLESSLEGIMLAGSGTVKSIEVTAINEGKDISFYQDGDKIICMKKSNSVRGQLIVSQFNKENRLIHTEFCDISIMEGGEKHFQITEGTEQVRVFLWESFETIAPKEEILEETVE